jgi:hypothetical protein
MSASIRAPLLLWGREGIVGKQPRATEDDLGGARGDRDMRFLLHRT